MIIFSQIIKNFSKDIDIFDFYGIIIINIRWCILSVNLIL